MILLVALSIGFTHTLLGPDHYIPFIVIGRARRWGLFTTSLLTFVCGVGHVLSSIFLGLLGLAAGRALAQIQDWEGIRGDWAGWALFLLGLGYTAWGLWRAKKGKGHHHHHPQIDHPQIDHPQTDHPQTDHPQTDHPQTDHPQTDHPHADDKEVAHEHGARKSWKTLTPWLLVLIFVLGPCEPLIPLFFASGLQGNWSILLMACLGYTIATLVGMHLMVTVFWYGLRKVSFGNYEKWSHAMAGGVIALAGAGMVFLGL